MKKISVLYVSYNSGAEILASVASLLSSGCRHELEIIAIDNASSDGSADRMAAQAGISVIASELNLGYARAVNLGIEAKNPERVFHLIDSLCRFIFRNVDIFIANLRLILSIDNKSVFEPVFVIAFRIVFTRVRPTALRTGQCASRHCRRQF